MSHLKLSKNIQTLPPIKQRKLTKKKQEIVTRVQREFPRFYAKSVYLDKKLIYVNFTSIKDVKQSQDPKPDNTHLLVTWLVITLLLLLSVCIFCLPYVGDTNDLSVTNNTLMASLVQLDSNSIQNINLITILNYNIL